jgi:hypothetical protein
MKGWKRNILLFTGLSILVISAVNVSAVTLTDGINDVYAGTSETFVSRPNIDIITVTYELSEDTVTFSMTVNGNIVDSEYILYTIWTNRNLTSGYTAQYQNGNGYVMKDMAFLDSEVSISQGNTIIFTFTQPDSIKIVEFVGSAMESHEDYSQGWIDYAPDDYLWDSEDEDEPDVDDEDEDTTGDDEDIILQNGDDIGGDGNGDKGDGAPGFEAIVVAVALAIVFIILRRKKL